MSTSAPLCGEAEFDELLDEMVTAEAPRLFAVVQVYSERVDGRVAAWGIAFEDHIEVVGVDGCVHMSLLSTRLAVRQFGRCPDVAARVVWVDPDAARPSDGIDAA